MLIYDVPPKFFIPTFTSSEIIIIESSSKMSSCGNISFFAYLYKLEIGNIAYITYHGNQYTYQLVNRYDVPKIGVVSIKRDYNKTCLTLITCTKDNDSLQTVYIFEQV